VREVEAFRAKSALGAQYESPSEDGSRPGVFNVNTFNLNAQPIFGMETLSLHEASPGYHFQISIAQDDTSLPKFRRFNTNYVAFVEGWALYAESLSKELGLFTNPYQWYGRLSDEHLRAMRLVVDTGLHAKDYQPRASFRRACCVPAWSSGFRRRSCGAESAGEEGRSLACAATADAILALHAAI
jgi:uncharacterized protein (DUF885 family)